MDYSLLEPTIQKYKNTKGSLIAILQSAQEIYGYIAPEVVAYIAKETGIKPAKILGVASFYAQFRLSPAGKHLISLCQGTACHVNGSNMLYEALTKELGIKSGGTTQDGLFTLFNVACLGCCSLSPAMMIDGEVYGNLTDERAVTILKKIREAAQ